MRVPEIFGDFFWVQRKYFFAPPPARVYIVYIHILWEPGGRVPEIFLGAAKIFFAPPPARVYIIYIYIYIMGARGAGTKNFWYPHPGLLYINI